MPVPSYFVEEAEKLEWRCNCIIQTLLGMYSQLGGCYIKVSGRQGKPSHYIFDAYKGSVLAHCGACHSWRELIYDCGTITEREFSGPRPGISCPCRE